VIEEIRAKTILVKSNLPDTDFVINPYTGCAFACSYCYASFMGRFVNKSIDEWGKYVYAKVNLPEILEKELQKLKNKSAILFISSVTDPYQGAETKYFLTKKALELLIKYRWEGSIGVLTKSPLVTRDIELFNKLPDAEVGMTITSAGDDISKVFEAHAPAVSMRLKALEELNAAGIKTYAFVGPLFPHLIYSPEKIHELFEQVHKTGVKELYVELINLSPYIKGRLMHEIGAANPKLLNFYSKPRKEMAEINDELAKLVKSFVAEFGFVLRAGDVIRHA
jgi:DNA repair photolyase